MSTGTRSADPQLDGALARAVRLLIAEAREAGQAAETGTEAEAADEAGSATA